MMIFACTVVALPYQSCAQPPCPCPGLRPAQSSPAYPADEARPQLAEIFEVKGTNARVELPSQEKVINGIPWKITEGEGTGRHFHLPPPYPLGPLSPEFPPGARAEAGAIRAFI
jgi:hypothetical protein